MTEPTAYLQGRVAQMFDCGSQGTPRWTITDAHAVRDVLDELRRLRSAKWETVYAARRGEDAQTSGRAEAS